MSQYIYFVYHHGGILEKDDKGLLQYKHGRIDFLEKVDVDYVNVRDIYTVFLDKGYQKCRNMYWMRPGVLELEKGLMLLERDSDVNDMCAAALGAGGNRMHVYFEDCIATPIILAAADEEYREDDGVAGHEGCEKACEDGGEAGDDACEDSFEDAMNAIDGSDDEEVPGVDTEEVVGGDEEQVVGDDAEEGCGGDEEHVVSEDAEEVGGGDAGGEGAMDASEGDDLSCEDGGISPEGYNAEDIHPSSDSYESAEDEMYKPPPPGYEDMSDDDEDLSGPIKQQQKKASKIKKNNKGKDKIEESEDEDEDDEEEVRMSFEEEGYTYLSDELRTPPTSEDDEGCRTVNPKYNEEAEFGKVFLELGMEFLNLQKFKAAVKDYNISLGRQFVWVKNEKTRVRAKCSNGDCEWMVYCGWNSKISAFQIKTFKDVHSCCRLFKNKRATRDWVARKLEMRLLTQPKMTRAEAYEHMKEEYHVHLDVKKVGKALKMAKLMVEGNEKEQYGILRDYLAELLRSNPGSSCKMDVVPQPQSPPLFDRLYICLDACKKGFKAGCRPLIGLDGCFLKGYYGGQLLTAVGEDANKQFYVIAFGIVDSETKDN